MVLPRQRGVSGHVNFRHRAEHVQSLAQAVFCLHWRKVVRPKQSKPRGGRGGTAQYEARISPLGISQRSAIDNHLVLTVHHAAR